MRVSSTCAAQACADRRLGIRRRARRTHGQESTSPRHSRAPSARRTPDGHPDLQGLSLNNTATPLERPKDSGPSSHVIERFTLTSKGALDYEFGLEDPETFTAAWSAASLLTRTRQRMFEFACHEANYSLTSTLRGARFADRKPKP